MREGLDFLLPVGQLCNSLCRFLMYRFDDKIAVSLSSYEISFPTLSKFQTSGRRIADDKIAFEL